MIWVIPKLCPFEQLANKPKVSKTNINKHGEIWFISQTLC